MRSRSRQDEGTGRSPSRLVSKWFLLFWLVACVAGPSCSDDAENGGGDEDATIGGTDADRNDGSVDPLECERFVLTQDVVNARELGGLPVEGDGFVECRKILRGGDLCGLSSDGCRQLSELGIRTVIDLRAEAVQQNEPPAQCVSQQAQVVSAALPKLLPDTEANYLALLDQTASLAVLFHTFADPATYPIYFHCVIGRDRASVVTALLLSVLGASRQAIMDEFMLSEDAGVVVKPECLEAVLDEIQNRGGIEDFLLDLGVTADEMEAIRAQVLLF